MLILPKVFIFAEDHELPPVIRPMFLRGNKRLYVCLAPLVMYIQKRSGLFVSFELCVPWDCVLNNLCLFLHQLLELFIFLISRRLRHDCEWLCSALVHASVHILEKVQCEDYSWFTR